MYSRETNQEGRDGIGTVLTLDMKENMLCVARENDRIIIMKVTDKTCPLNIVSADAPRTGVTEKEKGSILEKGGEGN